RAPRNTRSTCSRYSPSGPSRRRPPRSDGRRFCRAPRICVRGAFCLAVVTTAIVLAAGLSRRMGRPKLLLDLRGKPVIRHTVERLVAAHMDEILVGGGPEHAALQRPLNGCGGQL